MSIRSGEAVLRVLRERGHEACAVFVDRDVDLVLRQSAIDVAFVALQGRYGEDGCVQGLLELAGIPYSGSGVLASALAMNKAKAKEIFRLHNLPTPAGYVIDGALLEDVVDTHGNFGFPSIVKPSGEGSSLGVRLVRDELELEAAVDEALRFDDEVLVERFIEGKEIAVAVLNGRPLGAVELVHRRPPDGFGQRYASNRPDYQLPARISPERYRSVLRLAVQAQAALGCEGVTRVDIIVSERGNEAVLEVDTLPALTPGALVTRIAESAGLSFGDLVEEVLASARLRAHGHRRERRSRHAAFDGPERRAGAGGSAH